MRRYEIGNPCNKQSGHISVGLLQCAGGLPKSLVTSDFPAPEGINGEGCETAKILPLPMGALPQGGMDLLLVPSQSLWVVAELDQETLPNKEKWDVEST